MNDRARDSRRTGILRLRHLQEVTEAKAEEMADGDTSPKLDMRTKAGRAAAKAAAEG